MSDKKCDKCGREFATEGHVSASSGLCSACGAIANKPDMSKVKVGTRVRLRCGVETKITEAHAIAGYPFCTDFGWHRKDGSCCVRSMPQNDIVEILDDDAPVASPAHVPERTLRDEFAMAALTGFLAHGAYLNDATRWSFTAADAMMKARNAK